MQQRLGTLLYCPLTQKHWLIKIHTGEFKILPSRVLRLGYYTLMDANRRKAQGIREMLSYFRILYKSGDKNLLTMVSTENAPARYAL